MIFSAYELSILVLITGFITFLYFYLIRNFKYWESRNICGPKPIPIFGTSLNIFIKPKTEVELEWYKKYGKIYGVFNENTPALTVGVPELIKQVLVKDFHSFRNRRKIPSGDKYDTKMLNSARDDDWKKVRAIASPTFSSGKMKKMYSLINECCNEFMQTLDELAINREEIDLKQLHGCYTVDVIAKCAFATNTNTYKNPNNPFTKNAVAIFTVKLWKLILFISLPNWIIRIESFRKLVSGEARDFFLSFARHLIKQRRDNNEKHNDFLQLLMDAEKSDQKRDESDVNEAHHVNEGNDEINADIKALSNVIEKKLNETEILGQCFLFFVAGYETTATTLSFCSYQLALNPEIQDRLYDEIKDAFDENGDIDYETLSKLPFLDSVISETLRLHPPLLRLEREAMEDIKLEGTDITIAKGVKAEIPIYAIHHSEEYYENPFKFNPYRFMPENRANIKPYTYLPFGSGPRNCIGMRFALLEAKLALAKIIQKFRFFPTAKTDVPLIYNKGRALLQAKRLFAGIERRK